MKKYIYDIVIVFLILVGSLIAYFCVNKSKNVNISGNDINVIISVDGRKLYEYSLAENRTFVVNTEFGMNEIVINDGQVYILNADCPDKLCVHFSPIISINNSIYCLPNRLVVELKSNDLIGEYDAYVY